jgi:hypothetical protein
MDNSSRSVLILIGLAILAVVGIRIIPRLIGFFFSGMAGPLYVLAFILGAIGIVVLGVRWWWLRR